MDHGLGPAFRRGMDLAHTLCAAVAGDALARTEAGRRLRKAAVSVPSLVGDAVADLEAPDAAAALSRASAKLLEVADLLSQGPVRDSLTDAELTVLLAEIEAFRADLGRLLTGRPGAGGGA